TPEELDQPGLDLHVQAGDLAADFAVDRLVLGSGEREIRAPCYEQYVTFHPSARDETDVRHESDAADDRRGHDRAAIGLVVERDVSGDDRSPERLRCKRHPVDRLGELPGDLALLRVAEVQAVGQSDRLATRTGDVARRLEYSESPAHARSNAGD